MKPNQDWNQNDQNYGVQPNNFPQISIHNNKTMVDIQMSLRKMGNFLLSKISSNLVLHIKTMVLNKITHNIQMDIKTNLNIHSSRYKIRQLLQI